MQNAIHFSLDGRRLIVSRGIGQAFVLNADTGEALPPLEGTDLSRVNPGPFAFSGDGRLIAASGARYNVRKKEAGPARPTQTSVSSDGTFVTVWEAETGKVVKSWERRSSDPVTVAFNPARPLLAVLEPRADGIRVGFWDFAAGK